MTTSWGIVMTVREPAQLVLAHVGWHLGTGAREVHVFLDDPQDPVAERLSEIKGVRVTLCDDAYWRGIARGGDRPQSINRRQGLNATQAMAQCATDWLIHLDADEFLVQDRPLADELAFVRELDCEVHFPVHERLYRRDGPTPSIFSGLFRTTTKGLNRRTDGKSNDAIIFGAHSPLLHHGVLAHSAGKCAAPTNSDFRLGLHWAYRGTGRDRAQRYRSTSTRLLHFDGLTRLHWLSKLIRYGDTDPSVLKLPPHRQAQIEVFQDMAQSRDDLIEYHQEMRELDAAALARLRGFGLLYETPFDPASVIHQTLGFIPDLTTQAFDAALRRDQPSLPSGI